MSGSYDYIGPDGNTYKVRFCKMSVVTMFRSTGMQTRLAFTRHLHTFPRLIIITTAFNKITIIVDIIFQPVEPDHPEVAAAVAAQLAGTGYHPEPG